MVGIYWQDTLREALFGKFIFEQNMKFHYMTVQMEQSVLYMVRYCALSFFLLLGLIYGTISMFQKKVASDSENSRVGL